MSMIARFAASSAAMVRPVATGAVLQRAGSAAVLYASRFASATVWLSRNAPIRAVLISGRPIRSSCAPSTGAAGKLGPSAALPEASTGAPLPLSPHDSAAAAMHDQIAVSFMARSRSPVRRCPHPDGEARAHVDERPVELHHDQLRVELREAVLDVDRA